MRLIGGELRAVGTKTTSAVAIPALIIAILGIAHLQHPEIQPRLSPRVIQDRQERCDTSRPTVQDGSRATCFVGP